MNINFVCLICRHICETPVTEQTFIEQLHELHHKIDFAKEQSFKGALSVNDVGDVLEKLKVKVTSKDGTSCGCVFSAKRTEEWRVSGITSYPSDIKTTC